MFYRICLALCLTIFMSSGILAQSTPAPPDAEIDRFPLMPDTLSQEDVRRLGLRVDTLDASWEGFNFFRNVNRFAWDDLPAGTVVLVDGSGRVRYKQDCGNRLVELQEIENALTVTGTTLSVADSLALSVRLSGDLNVFHRFDEAFLVALSRMESNSHGSPVVPVQASPPPGWWSRHWGEVAIIGTATGVVICAILCRGRVNVNVTQIN